MRVRRIPNETDAWKAKELKSLPLNELPDVLQQSILEGRFIGGDFWQVQTQNGWVPVKEEDYLLIDSAGVLYPVPADVFESSYEILDDSGV